MNDLIELVKKGYNIEFSMEEDGLFCITITVNHETKWFIKPPRTNKQIKKIIKETLKSYNR